MLKPLTHVSPLDASFSPLDKPFFSTVRLKAHDLFTLRRVSVTQRPLGFLFFKRAKLSSPQTLLSTDLGAAVLLQTTWSSKSLVVPFPPSSVTVSDRAGASVQCQPSDRVYAQHGRFNSNFNLSWCSNSLS